MIFADGFAGKYKDPGRAAHRPSGVAVGADGASTSPMTRRGVSGASHSTVIRALQTSRPPSPTVEAATSPEVLPPEGIHPNAGTELAALSVPPGATSGEVTLGKKIFKATLQAQPAPVVTVPRASARLWVRPQQRDLALG